MIFVTVFGKKINAKILLLLIMKVCVLHFL